MPHSLDIVLSDFKSDVARVENLLTLTKLFRDFGASEPPSAKASPSESSSVEENISEQEAKVIDKIWKEAVALHTESKSRRTDLPILSGSLLLYLAGRFEYYIRQIVESIADEIAGKTHKFQDLPNQIQKSLRQKTLEIAQNPKKYGHDELTSEALLESLVINIRGSGQCLSIKSEVLSITDANMRPAVLQDLMKTVGLTEFWRDVGKQANIKIVMGKSLDQEAAAEAQVKLNQIMEERNQIAHPTATTEFPDADKVLKSAEFLNILAATTADLGKVYLATYAVQ